MILIFSASETVSSKLPQSESPTLRYFLQKAQLNKPEWRRLSHTGSNQLAGRAYLDHSSVVGRCKHWAVVIHIGDINVDSCSWRHCRDATVYCLDEQGVSWHLTRHRGGVRNCRASPFCTCSDNLKSLAVSPFLISPWLRRHHHLGLALSLLGAGLCISGCLEMSQTLPTRIVPTKTAAWQF